MMSMHGVIRGGGDSHEYEVKVRREGSVREDLETNPYMSLYMLAIKEFFALLHPARAFQGYAVRETHSVPVNTAGLIIDIADMKIRAGNTTDLGLDISRSTSVDSMGLLILSPLIKVLSRNIYTTYARPKDRIYAFIGLSPDSSWTGLSINYIRPVREIFIQAAWAIIKASRDLRLLSFIEERTFRGVDGLPTWIPDFSARRYLYPLDTFDETCPYSASRDIVHCEDTL